MTEEQYAIVSPSEKVFSPNFGTTYSLLGSCVSCGRVQGHLQSPPGEMSISVRQLEGRLSIKSQEPRLSKGN